MNEMTETKNGQSMAAYDPSMIYGFKETKQEDIIVPRIKVINALSPERQDRIAEEGDILNSLTQEKLNGKRFIPVKQYYSNIEWNPDRNAELRMFCRSFDGHIGIYGDGTKACETCKRNQFDNTKTGKEAQPPCTSYLNFLGFFEDDPMPVVLSFAKTNYNEGKKMLSIAKSMRKPLWAYGYILDGKEVAKDKNRWFIITTRMTGATSQELQDFAFNLYQAYQNTTVSTDYEDTGYSGDDGVQADQSMKAEI
jgi:hypothetical protein